MGTSQKLYQQAKKIIPGGTQLLSKRPEMFLPGLWPAYYSKAKGCQVWDLDGRKYTDTSFMGIGACVLGYSDRDVDKAVGRAIENGSMATLNCPEEVQLAKLLVNIHKWADMARFARSGGEAMTIAVRLARAKTGKDLVLFCGYHGWHDWYLSANLAGNKSLDGHLLPGLEPRGVPRALKGTSIPFAYNDTAGFLKLMKEHKGSIAAVITEPIRNHYPEKGFLGKVKSEAKKAGAVLIFDEITSGWRLNAGGAHLKFNVTPDIAVFAKGMSNGFPMAAIIGTRKVMQMAQDSFISSTYWTERIGPAAALATINKLKKLKVHQHLEKIGKMVQCGWAALAKKHNLDISVCGIYSLSHFSFNHKDTLALKTLFTQFMLEKGFLATTVFYVSYAHKEEHVNKYLKAADRAFAFLSKTVKAGCYKKYLRTPVCHSGFRRLT